jgi:hypothetical protein
MARGKCVPQKNDGVVGGRAGGGWMTRGVGPAEVILLALSPDGLFGKRHAFRLR